MTGSRCSLALVGRAFASTTIMVLTALTWASAPSAPAAADPWRPSLGDRLHLQLSGTLHVPTWATLVEVDGAEATADEVATLRQSGHRLVCYISAGSAEDYRGDLDQLPPVVLGKRLEGWPDERWLDIRRTDLLLPLMSQRIQDCARKGFDAIEFDNMDAYANDTGFPITVAHQRRYARAVAEIARQHRLAPGLKNAPELVPSLVDAFDWALVEQCVEFSTCRRYRPFISQGKPVFAIEYRNRGNRGCALAAKLGIDLQVKHRNLNDWTSPCS
ncbi:MAG: endo alpha-1,4 polygalactosaminidase [Actinomycetales bacterium]|nr:endo alpha-1,4 polygalactosaminidase [Actinomycetales bacterium]